MGPSSQVIFLIHRCFEAVFYSNDVPQRRCLFPSNTEKSALWQADSIMSELCNNHYAGMASGEHWHFITYMDISVSVRKPLACPLTTVKSSLQTCAQVIGSERVGAWGLFSLCTLQNRGKTDQALAIQAEVQSWLPLISSQALPLFPKRDTGSFGWVGGACSDTANPRKRGTSLPAALSLPSHHCFLASTRAPRIYLVASTCLPSKTFWKLFLTLKVTFEHMTESYCRAPCSEL